MKRIFLSLVILSLLGCSNDEPLSDKSVLESKNKTKVTELDDYIRENFQEPYNIKVTYKWEDSDFEQNKYLYPPTAEKVKPILEIVKKIWIEPYEIFGGKDFVKLIAPRQLSLIGGYNVNQNGTITLGFADSGMKITLFNVDQLDTTDKEELRQYFHTIQHEYCHILNQTKPFDPSYGGITTGYTGNWNLVSEQDALNKGYITPYSMANSMEDFAEITSGMLSMSKTEFDAQVNKAATATAKANIRKKEAMVASYFKTNFGIDIYELQAEVYNRINSL